MPRFVLTKQITMTKILDKLHKDYIYELLKDQGITADYIRSYCRGAGIDTNNYSSPVHISDGGKLTIRYRGINSYFQLITN